MPLPPAASERLDDLAGRLKIGPVTERYAARNDGSEQLVDADELDRLHA